jgi:SAM-dependent methyltransferase
LGEDDRGWCPARSPAFPSEKRISVHLIRDRLRLLELLPSGGVGAEIGVQRGDYAAEMLRRAAPRKLYLIDCWRWQPGPYEADKSNVSDEEHEAFLKHVRERFRTEIEAGRVVVVRALAHEALPAFPAGYFDWVYLDADHSYDAVRRDLRLCARVLKAGGLLCGHDLCPEEDVAFGVVRAVEEFCRDDAWEIFLLTDHDPLCDGKYESFALRQVPPVVSGSPSGKRPSLRTGG